MVMLGLPYIRKFCEVNVPNCLLDYLDCLKFRDFDQNVGWKMATKIRYREKSALMKNY